jgi:hypothetical protein
MRRPIRGDVTTVVSGDLDAGGGCASLSFVDPTSSVPLSVDLVLAAPAKLTVPFSNDCCVGHTGPCTSSFSRSMGLYWSGQTTCALDRLPDSYVNAGVEQGSTTRLGFAAVGFVSAGDALYCQ